MKRDDSHEMTNRFPPGSEEDILAVAIVKKAEEETGLDIRYGIRSSEVGDKVIEFYFDFKVNYQRCQVTQPFNVIILQDKTYQLFFIDNVVQNIKLFLNENSTINTENT